MGGSNDHSKSSKGKRSHGGKGGKGRGSKRGKSDKGKRDSNQGSKGAKGIPDGGLSPPKLDKKPRIGGMSVGEGAWRLVPLPDDRVLKVQVPFLGKDLCDDGEKWNELKKTWEEQFKVDIDLRGRKSRGWQYIGNCLAQNLAIIGPERTCVQKAFDHSGPS